MDFDPYDYLMADHLLGPKAAEELVADPDDNLSAKPPRSRIRSWLARRWPSER